MDYKYIKQLLERYWNGETTLEEEDILRTFFSQTDIPAELESVKPLFAYQAAETKEDVLGDDFDEKLLNIIDETEAVKARTIPFTQRLMPLFKAAAIVAIILTLGNAAQVAMNNTSDNNNGNFAATEQTQTGVSVAMRDSTIIDSMKQSKLQAIPQMENGNTTE